MAERLADKYEEAKEKQEDIMNRWVQTMLLHLSPPASEERGRRWHPGLSEDPASEIPFVGAQGRFSVLLQVQSSVSSALGRVTERETVSALV